MPWAHITIAMFVFSPPWVVRCLGAKGFVSHWGMPVALCGCSGHTHGKSGLQVPQGMLCFFFFLKEFIYFYYLFIYLFMAVLGLRFCARAFSSCGERGPLFIAVRGPLTIAASPVAEHRLQTRRLSSCGARA